MTKFVEVEWGLHLGEDVRQGGKSRADCLLVRTSRQRLQLTGNGRQGDQAGQKTVQEGSHHGVNGDGALQRQSK